MASRPSTALDLVGRSVSGFIKIPEERLAVLPTMKADGRTGVHGENHSDRHNVKRIARGRHGFGLSDREPTPAGVTTKDVP